MLARAFEDPACRTFIFKRTGVRGRRFVSTQAAGEALLGDGPYPADVRPLPNAEYVR